MKVRSKLWIEVQGEPVFGRGRGALLRAIGRYGSINRAAREIDVSYRKAWSYIDVMEKRLGIPLVTRRTGGRGGGGSTLTPEGREFLKRFEALDKAVRGFADVKFNSVFGDMK